MEQYFRLGCNIVETLEETSEVYQNVKWFVYSAFYSHKSMHQRQGFIGKFEPLMKQYLYINT